ncbi:hypothetical protein F2Q68_00012057 [Brassica cretica]|uniref:Uncharacterized protein n=1 Tax=Brassica cretica TaxID=69181 RepID=A0A8S9KYS6_BRACR|nr:hypothetical protein F2Q68_00012057 [Brassica cretica]
MKPSQEEEGDKRTPQTIIEGNSETHETTPEHTRRAQRTDRETQEEEETFYLTTSKNRCRRTIAPHP